MAKAAPDGYTLLAGGGSQLTVLSALSARAGYDPAKEFAPVAKFHGGLPDSSRPFVHSSSPWTLVKDLINDPRVHQRALNWAHSDTVACRS